MRGGGMRGRVGKTGGGRGPLAGRARRFVGKTRSRNVRDPLAGRTRGTRLRIGKEA